MTFYEDAEEGEAEQPFVPTITQLKARWEWNRDWDDACFKTAMEEME
jgi:hypothetical protein